MIQKSLSSFVGGGFFLPSPPFQENEETNGLISVRKQLAG
jgi:hypothetical protein